MDWRIYYYETARGESPIETFLGDLSTEERAKCLAYMDLLESEPLRLPANIAKQVEGKLWELRPEYGGVEMRLLYFFFVERRIVFVHALKKKRQALERGDVDLATRRMNEVLAQAASDETPSVRPRVPRLPAPEPQKPSPKRKKGWKR